MAERRRRRARARYSGRPIHELDRIVIDVVDACGGLAPEVARSMFETHSHGGHARSGYGIGLTIAERAVAAHAGTISVVDRPGVGCRFRVCLPTAAAQAPEPGSVSPQV
jgi:signal transduction histidine kinase